MKNKHSALQMVVMAAIMLLALTACDTTDFGEIQRRTDAQQAQIDDHEARIKALEALMKKANEDIATLRTLVDATQLLSVKSYNELADKSGYELLMSDDSKITLKHGATGATGAVGAVGATGAAGASTVVNVQLMEGQYFWTLNGELLRDANNNPVPATGAKGDKGEDGGQGEQGQQGNQGSQGGQGAAGQTPLLRINSDYLWEVSLDGGTRWEAVTDADDNPVPAIGPDGIVGPAGLPGQPGLPGPAGPAGPDGKDGDPQLSIVMHGSGEFITVTYREVEYRIFIVPQEPEEPDPDDQPYITFTVGGTASPKTVKLAIDALQADQADVWIDLNNNRSRDDGESVTQFNSSHDVVTYTLADGVTSATLYGKVTNFLGESNSLTALDVKNNTVLTSLYCNHNYIETLDVSACTGLTHLHCHVNKLATLDVSHNTRLIQLDCYYNLLTSLDISQNPMLWVLACYRNRISGDAMTALVNALPDRTEKTSSGIFQIFQSMDDLEENECTVEQVGVATGKNWKVIDAKGDRYPGS